jgi:2-keto-4-pentenoate hydratase/2-oxohepta-3-ene-1,7-dioic acid hydratase in catechol pathway
VKIATLVPYGTGIVCGDGVVPVESRPMSEVIGRWNELKDQLAALPANRPHVPFDKVRLGPPVPRPSKIWAAAGNYRRGTSELGQGTGRGETRNVSPEELLDNLFLKAPSSVTGPNTKIVIPREAETIFPELELCVVIGKQSRDLSEDDVWPAIFGYTIMLDVTARGYGAGGPLMGTRDVRKGFDTFSPIGPWIVTRDEVPDPENLQMKLSVNGELRQSARTDAMINGIPRLLGYLSMVSTLMPGDLITTGNPDSPEFQQKLQPGDEIKAEIEGIGAMTLTVAKQE